MSGGRSTQKVGWSTYRGWDGPTTEGGRVHLQKVGWSTYRVNLCLAEGSAHGLVNSAVSGDEVSDRRMRTT